jgi:hypothetical protein
MEPTPLEHEVVALATKFTLVPTVLLFDGLDTVTPANVVVAMEQKTKIAVEMETCFFISTFLSGLGFGLGPVKLYSAEGYTDQARDTLESYKHRWATQKTLGCERSYVSGGLNVYRLHPSVKGKVPYLQEYCNQ